MPSNDPRTVPRWAAHNGTAHAEWYKSISKAAMAGLVREFAIRSAGLEAVFGGSGDTERRDV